MTTEKLKKLPHIFSGAIILLHSLERFDSGHESYLIFLACGAVFLLLAVFHHTISRKFPLVDVVFYLIEGLLSVVIALEFYSAGKKGLPIAYTVAGLFQFFAVFMFWHKAKKHKSR